MRTFVLGLVLGVATLAGAARGDTFVVVPTAAAGVTLPSASDPNAGSLVLPAHWTSPPAVPVQRSYAELQELWWRAGAAYGIPWQVLGAINKVESNFGRNMGPSSAGAIGWMQFMPSTWERWGTDANGDEIADPWNPDDAVYSAARYLAASGGQNDIARAVFSYNHAQWYVDEVLGLARVYDRGAGVAASFEHAQADLKVARRRAVAANRRLVASLRRARTLGRQVARLRARAEHAELLSDRLALERRAVQVDVKRQAALSWARAHRADLAAARAALERATRASAQASFAPAAPLLGAPSGSNGWVFPVGGGPGLVSVSHHHHDYPAADIAAPEGSPVYALADAIVQRAWSTPDARCGIGLTLRTSDGRSWTYCHLSVLDDAVRAGAFLSAGAPVGLVGSTGDASGPHLHLQLNPTTSYPQSEAWFESFAGVAFTWQDAATPRAHAPHPVFAVVPANGGAVPFTR
jgi:murein DD-endopeptidase MepM/ murein hydrolase activator NlpD